ncbi:transposase [Mycobacterium sp. PO1]|nr:transposase [Mycobacterium sp. PO1]GFM26076.1 transposase [Mycobacterium sp. PO2]
MSHRNAPLSETGRLRLARCIVEDGWPLRRAAERFQVAVTTAARWAARYREFGANGMSDRSSRPHRSPNRTPTRTERRIIKVRVIRRWGPARIAYLLGLHPSTVHRVLTRYGLAKLRWLDRATGRVIRRMESPACGDLVHVDVKKLGKIPAGGGWRMLGKAKGKHNARADRSSGVLTADYKPSVSGWTCRWRGGWVFSPGVWLLQTLPSWLSRVVPMPGGKDRPASDLIGAWHRPH